MNRKEQKKNNKWMRGLGKKLIKDILAVNPKEVNFYPAYPKAVSCNITTENGSGTGLAICSTLDKFDEKVGRNKAAGRALCALMKRDSSHNIRDSWDKFPNSWNKAQIIRVLEFAEEDYKSVYSNGV